VIEQCIMCRWVSLEVEIDQALESGVSIGIHERFPGRMRPPFYE
jgi:hypothetical protein